MKRILIIIATTLVAASCAGVDRYNGKHPVVLSAANEVPQGLLRAEIVEVDGTAVGAGMQRIRLAAGSHSVKVWPQQYGAWQQRTKPGQFRLASLEFEAVAGAHYAFAARQRRYRTAVSSASGAQLVESPWQTIILPEIVQTTETDPQSIRIAGVQ